MAIDQSMIATYTYKGRDDMIDLNSEKIPQKPHKDFKATLKLKDGREVLASKSWRTKIWYWWYEERQNELIKRNNRAMVDVANSMLNQKHKIAYNEDDL
jgi:hypothetical protein